MLFYLMHVDGGSATLRKAHLFCALAEAVIGRVKKRRELEP